MPFQEIAKGVFKHITIHFFAVYPKLNFEVQKCAFQPSARQLQQEEVQQPLSLSVYKGKESRSFEQHISKLF